MTHLKTVRLWLLTVLGFSLTLVVAGVASVTHPDLLKPLLASGLSLEILEPLPVLGDAVRAAEAPELTVQELKAKLDRREPQFLLVDVRSPEEYAIAKIPGAILIPITEIEQGPGVQKIQSLLGDRQLISYCYSGKRSYKALATLRKAGIIGVNVKGGIVQWRDQIDPSLPQTLL